MIKMKNQIIIIFPWILFHKYLKLSFPLKPSITCCLSNHYTFPFFVSNTVQKPFIRLISNPVNRSFINNEINFFNNPRRAQEQSKGWKSNEILKYKPKSKHSCPTKTFIRKHLSLFKAQSPLRRELFFL